MRCQRNTEECRTLVSLIRLVHIVKELMLTGGGGGMYASATMEWLRNNGKLSGRKGRRLRFPEGIRLEEISWIHAFKTSPLGLRRSLDGQRRRPDSLAAAAVKICVVLPKHLPRTIDVAAHQLHISEFST
jgi:hypothetical protein